MIYSRKKHILYIISLVISTGIIVLQFYRGVIFDAFSTPSKNKREPSPLQDDEDSFLSDWCRLQRSRVDWEDLLGTCRSKMSWKHREKDSECRTDPDKSFISRWDISKQGEFSRFFVQSVTSDGHMRKTGGDSWRVYIRQGPASLAPTVFDNDDGTYEVMFLVLEPGNYSVQVFLDYTLCDGFRDPPEDWFIRGNVQGRAQKHGMLGYIGDDYLKAPLQRGKQAEFHVKKSDSITGYFKYIEPLVNASQAARSNLSKVACGIDCPLLWNGFGRWVDRKWMPYLPEENKSLHQNKEANMETLLVYGDSIALHYHALANTLPLCGQVFRRCDKKYMWIYDADWKGRDDNDFNQSIVVQEIKQALTRPDMRGQNSLFLFNIGIHYSISLNLTTYQKLISSVIATIKQGGTGDKDDETALSSQAMSVWRGSTAIEREYAGKYYGGDNLTDWRFHTSPRVQLFHRYATGEMCKAGIPVLDMYPLTAAWPLGTVRHDHIHYPSEVMKPAVKILERYVTDKQHK